MRMNGTVIQWRQTPKSKNFVAVVPPTVLPGVVTVRAADEGYLELQIDDEQADTLDQWTSGLPSDVMRPSAIDTRTLSLHGPHTVIGPDYAAGAELRVGETVMVRIMASVAKVSGPLRKTQLCIVDVLQCGVPAADHA